ncbi:TraB/GumN family protein [Marilutibacter maris]|nr:TraB/GumN family protein [Lysobacter maris]
MSPRLSPLVLATALSALAVSPMSPAAARSGVEAPAAPEPVRDLDTIVVSGVVPGPGLWKVGRDGHVLWVLGTLSPLPKKMEWEARDVEQVIAQAQEVMLAPSVSIKADVGFFRGLALAPRLVGARKNPDGKRLRELVPAANYARWQVLKERYIGRDRGVESWRPMFAALKLYEEAVEDTGLRIDDSVSDRVEALAGEHGVTLSKPGVEVVIEDPKQAITEFKQGRIDDLACFDRTLDRLETDLAFMRDRANAWAVGDVEGLRALPYTDQFEACRDAARNIQALRSRAGDLPSQVHAQWLGEAERALSNNAITLALLPMRELLSSDGLAAELRARGYSVQAPGEYEEEAPAMAGDYGEASPAAAD